MRRWIRRRIDAFNAARRSKRRRRRERLLRPSQARCDELEGRISELQEDLQQLECQLRLHSDSIRCFAEDSARRQFLPGPTPAREPLVSIVMPAWNAEETIIAAVESVRAQSYAGWELLIVDDGSADSTGDLLGRYRGEKRIRLIEHDHRGVSYSRNRALHAARGEIVTYLDADNTWYPDYLLQVSAAFARYPDQTCVYFSQLVHRADRSSYFVRGADFDAAALERGNFIDLNVFAHRRTAYERWGGFDESLERLNDWELIRRYCRDQAALHVPAIGGTYFEHRPNSIGATARHWLPYYRIQRKFQHPIASGLRVLYVLEEFPQRSETYIRWEMECMRRWGVEIEVWRVRDLSPASPYPTDVVVRDGPLADAIDAFQPHVVHCHWLYVGVDAAAEVGKTGRTMTVRGHSFEHGQERVAQLVRSYAVEGVYLFPHFLDRDDSPKLQKLNVSVNAELYFPEEKDRRLVIRTAAGLPYKDIVTFLETAARCPEFRFILAVTHVHTHEAFLDELRDRNESLGSPVEIWHDVPTEELAATVRRAGICLHTNDPGGHRFGMPISIAEAMATGSHVIVRRSPDSMCFAGDRATYYENAEEAAAQIRKTLDWSDGDWRDVARRNSEYALEHFGDVCILRPVLDNWMKIAERRSYFFAPRGAAIDERLPALVARQSADSEPQRSNMVAHCTSTAYGVMNAEYGERIYTAAALHSVYGTTRRVDSPEAGPGRELRDRVAALIGEAAERLVYYYCAMDTADFYDRILKREQLTEIQNRFTGSPEAVSPQQFTDLCVMHLFDELERTTRGEPPRYQRVQRQLAERLGGNARQVYESLYLGERIRPAGKKAA